MGKTKIDELIDNLKKFPGVGQRTAQTLSKHILKMETEDVEKLCDSIIDVKAAVQNCAQCFGLSSELSEDNLCVICSDESRDHRKVCVVEESFVIEAFESTNAYNGVYHCLWGLLDPHRGVEPENLLIEELINDSESYDEIIIATNPDTRGNLTAMYLAEQLREHDVSVTRIACGIPAGGDIQSADQVTLATSLAGRHDV